ncbi:hypothetical protein V1478_002011 [Vespula squamosa]|uniref:Uncharacterized protein n=1 Tax=Vespula squamosa TaxID=30214 RepID=A0ABD2BYU8_VESSQ
MAGARTVCKIQLSQASSSLWWRAIGGASLLARLRVPLALVEQVVFPGVARIIVEHRLAARVNLHIVSSAFYELLGTLGSYF